MVRLTKPRVMVGLMEAKLCFIPLGFKCTGWHYSPPFRMSTTTMPAQVELLAAALTLPCPIFPVPAPEKCFPGILPGVAISFLIGFIPPSAPTCLLGLPPIHILPLFPHI